MPDQGITVTPTLVTNPDGSESVSYEQANVVSTDGRQRAIAQFNAEQENYIREDSQGNRSHAFDLGEQFDEITYQPPTPTTQGVPLGENDIAYIQDQVGGPDAFNDMLSWASHNTPPEIIARFNEITNSSDVAEIENAVKALYEFYSENKDEDLSQVGNPNSSAFVDDYFPTDEEVEEQDEFADAMFALIGGEANYNTLMGWAENNLTENSIQIFDSIMDSGDYSAKEQAIKMLIKSFREQEED